MKHLLSISAALLALGLFIPMRGLAADWWNAPGSLSLDVVGSLPTGKTQHGNANAFAADLNQSLKTGKRLSYLNQGGISPNWYRPPLQVEPFPGAYDARLYDLAYHAFLQSRQLRNVYRLAWNAVKKKPDSKIWRKRLIQVATWLGQREEALHQWHWLATHGDIAARKQTITLAASLSRPDIIVDMLSPAGRKGALTQAQWKTLIYAYGELGRPDEAIADIDTALRHRRSRFLLTQKAYLSYQVGDIERSLGALQKVTAAYGPAPDIALKEARLLIMKSDFRQAMAVMNAAKAKAAIYDIPFWHLYAILAWNVNDRKQALAAEKQLYLLGVADTYDFQRLIMLTQQSERRAALAVARQGWKQFHLPIFFFEGISLAADQADWPALSVLLQAIPGNDPQGLKQYSAYWIATARLAAARHELGGALAAYTHALNTSPGNSAIETDMLWLLVDQKDETRLRSLLISDLGSARKMRNALISAMQLMHRPQLALYLQTRDNSDETPTGLLNRADVFSDNGFNGIAWAQRQRVAEAMAQRIRREEAKTRAHALP